MEKSGALILILLVCVPFLSGCIQAKTTLVNSYQSTLAPSREIRIENAQTAEVYQQITDPQGISNFLDQLKLDEWVLATLPSDQKARIRCRFFHEAEAGPNETTLTQFATLLLYEEGPYAAMQIQGTSVVFEMSKAGCDALTRH
ncbi:hypothetical protein [Eubacterium sp.]|uniref:hypothetical protein n=1 Tax=Eubacterium sp. TaxID=142586 RepID=UPI002FCA6539